MATMSPVCEQTNFDEADRDDHFLAARMQIVRGHGKKLNEGTWMSDLKSIVFYMEVEGVSNKWRKVWITIDMEMGLLDLTSGKVDYK